MTIDQAIIESSWGIGAALGPAIGGFLNLQGGFSLPFYLVGAWFLLDAIMLVCCFQDAEKEKDEDSRYLNVHLSTFLIKKLSLPVGKRIDS